MDGMGWVEWISLWAPPLRAPLCGANNDENGECVNDDVGTLLPDSVTDLAAKTFFIPQLLSYKSLVTLYFVFISGAYRRGAFRNSIPTQPTHL